MRGRAVFIDSVTQRVVLRVSNAEFRLVQVADLTGITFGEPIPLTNLSPLGHIVLLGNYATLFEATTAAFCTADERAFRPRVIFINGYKGLAALRLCPNEFRLLEADCREL